MYNYGNYNYGDIAQTTQVKEGLAFPGAFAIVLGIIVIALAVFMIITYVKLFKKAGKPGWAVIVPYYNAWILNEIAEAHWIWFIAFIVASAGASSTGSFSSACSALLVIIDLIISINIAKKFGKSTGFGVLCALLPIIGYPILAFGSAEYDPTIEVPLHGIFERDYSKKDKKEVKKPSNECPKCNGKITAKMNNCPNCGTKLK